MNWEYWPFGVIQLPVFFYYFFLVIKHRSFTFFSASNPGIEMGGMFGESKYDVLKKIPQSKTPKTILVNHQSSADQILREIDLNGLSFPLIFKPDLGERGHLVRKISSKDDIVQYLKEVRINFIIQELVDLPLEFGVFYVRLPDEEKGEVISITGKEMLTVTGDGKSTLQELILSVDRAKLQWNKLKIKYAHSLNDVLKSGQSLQLVSIGNHALGTKFLNENRLINHTLNESFDLISKSIPGFYFGRFDLRCESLEDLYAGNVKIMELNGCGAEPAHIYDPKYSLFKAIGVLLKHWYYIDQISTQNRQRGVRYISFKEAKGYYYKFKAATST